MDYSRVEQSPAIESALGNGQSGPAVAATGTDAHIYQTTCARRLINKTSSMPYPGAPIHVGRIRYELGRKIKTKRVPDLRFKHYEFQQQPQRRLSIDSLCVGATKRRFGKRRRGCNSVRLCDGWMESGTTVSMTTKSTKSLLIKMT